MRKLLFSLALAPALASGQPLEPGTYDVEFQRLSVAGRLEGCSLVFTALARDTAYLRGELVVVNGSLAIRTLGRANTLAFVGKLGTRQLSEASGKWSAPSHFFFSSKRSSTAEKAKVIESDTPGYRMLVASADGELIDLLTDLVSTSEFTVGFNRKPTGQDVLVPIRIDVSIERDSRGQAVRRTNEKTGEEFAECISSLAKSLQR